MYTPVLIQVDTEHFSKFVHALRQVKFYHPDVDNKMFLALEKIKGLWSTREQSNAKITLLSPKAVYYLDALQRALDSSYASDAAKLPLDDRDEYLEAKITMDKTWGIMMDFARFPAKGYVKDYHKVGW